MPVRDLAPALLALGELFTEASAIAYPDREPVSLHIRATDRGSFIADLGLHSPQAWEQMIQVLSGSAVTALVNLQGIIFSGGGLLWLIKLTRGQPVSKADPLESGMVRVTMPDGTTFEALPDALALYQRESARRNARQVVEPLRRPGVDRLDFQRGDATELTIERDDLPAYESEPAEEPLSEEERDVIVTLVVASVQGEYKWRFSEGDLVFTASLADPEFLARIEAGEAFRKGDWFKLKIRVVQTRRGDKLQVERTVVKVIEHIPRQLQAQIDFEMDDEED